MSRSLFVNCTLVLAAIGLPLASQGQTLNQQAQSQANSFWNQRLTRCGDTAYVAFKNGEVDAFKNAQIVVQAQPLNEADRLNGWEWKGITGFTATATRMWVAHETLGVYGPLGWQPWVSGTGPAGMFGIYTASVERLHGAWRVVPNPVFPLSEMKAFNCSQIPPEQFDPNSALVQHEFREAACRRFMSAANGGSPIAGWDQVASLRFWMTTIRDRSGQDVPGPGVDPKTCRDDKGNTVLMMLAGDLNPPVDAIQYLLSLGVDVNATNNTGGTAMSMAQYAAKSALEHGYNGIANNKVISLLQSAMSPVKQNPGLAITKMIACANPDVDVLGTDELAGNITVQYKKTGKVVTMTFDEAKSSNLVRLQVSPCAP